MNVNNVTNENKINSIDYFESFGNWLGKTAVFALAHLFNSPDHPAQVVPLGLVCSVLQEKYCDCAAIGAHLTNNFILSLNSLPHWYRMFFLNYK